MRIRTISLIIVLVSMLCLSCATSTRGTQMKKVRKKRCNCPTFAYQVLETPNTYMYKINKK